MTHAKADPPEDTDSQRPDQRNQPKRPNRQPDNPNDRTSKTEMLDVHTHASRSDGQAKPANQTGLC
jgi:hypothetical protein